jgi:hypothetical protein
VPAHQSLWSYFDEASHHCRRYEIADLTTKLSDLGFEIEYITPLFGILLPLMRLQRGSQRKRKPETATDDLKIVPGINGLLSLLLKLEVPHLAKREVLRSGTSILAIARAK